MNRPQPLCRLREDIKILRTGPRAFRLIDPQGGLHYELRPDERFLLELLEQHETLDALLTAFRQTFGRERSSREILEFFEQLRRAGLLATGAEDVAKAPRPIHEGHVIAALRGNAVNVCFDLLALAFGWLIHPVMLLVVLPLALIEAQIVWHHWAQGLAELDKLWQRLPTPPLLLATYVQTVLLLDLPMALLSGIACRALHGRVSSFGLTWGNWVLPTFSFTTNVGESVVLFDKRSCWTYLTLNFLAPIALSAVYAILWAAASPASNVRIFWLMMIPCSLAVVVYQFNIFSPYTGGCWMLSKAAGDWNLRNRAMAETRAWLQWRISPEPLSPRQRFWLRIYGLGIYLVRYGIDLLLLFGGGYWVTSRYGVGGAVTFALLFAWWNRSYLGSLWRLTDLGRFARVRPQHSPTRA